MGLAHVVPADRLAAEEVARLVYLIGRVDASLEPRSLAHPRGKSMALLGERRLLSQRLESWLAHFALTPRSRAEWVRALTELREFERESLPPFALEEEAVADEDLEEEIAALSAPVGGCEHILTDALSGRPSSALASVLADVLGPGVRFPDLAAAIRSEVERRAREIASR